MDVALDLLAILIFPAGLTLLLLGLIYEWVDRKLLAQFQNRVGPRWFQPLADVVKLLAKEEVLPQGVNRWLFIGLPVIWAGRPTHRRLYTAWQASSPPTLHRGSDRVRLPVEPADHDGSGWLQRHRPLLDHGRPAPGRLFSTKAPSCGLLGPALVAGSWQVSEIIGSAGGRWLLLTQPVGFVVALIGLMGKLELPPFDAPEAETEIVAGALTEYSGRGLALFRIGRNVAMVVGLTLIAALYMGGIANPLAFVAKTLGLLVIVAALQAVLARLRIDQTVGLWWRYGALLVLLQWAVIIVARGGVS
jgi:NADH-quinone oxidoreductase subunit H